MFRLVHADKIKVFCRIREVPGKPPVDYQIDVLPALSSRQPLLQRHGPDIAILNRMAVILKHQGAGLAGVAPFAGGRDSLFSFVSS